MAPIVSDSYTKKLLRLISWSHWFTFFNIGAALLLSTLYFFADPAPDTLIGSIYLGTNWLSHMAFLTFMSFVLFVFPIILLFPQTRFIRGYASLMFTVTLFLLVLDAFAYNNLGYHLSNSSISQIFELVSNQIEKDSYGFWSTAIVVGSLILAFELVVSNYAWKHIKQLQQTVFAKYTVGFFVSLFFVSHLVHIWADAKLNYDVLKQDSLMPFSYPFTAKKLLAKYDLFDEEGYLESKGGVLQFEAKGHSYPTELTQCASDKPADRSVHLILSKHEVTEALQNQFLQRTNVKNIRLDRHVNSSTMETAWFGLLYGLPSVYQQTIVSNNKPPILFEQLKKQGLETSLIRVGSTENSLPQALTDLFDNQASYSNSAELIYNKGHQNKNTGLHVYYFDTDSSYQLELFVDAFLLNQKQKEQKDIIWISQLTNIDYKQAFEIKPTVLIWPELDSDVKKQRLITSQFDIAPTLIHHWLACEESMTRYSVGSDIFNLPTNRTVADIINGGLMIYNKDQSVFVDRSGNFQSFSRQLNQNIELPSNYPMMIDAANFIQSFGKETK